jgi:hypothetical protein
VRLLVPPSRSLPTMVPCSPRPPRHTGDRASLV